MVDSKKETPEITEDLPVEKKQVETPKVKVQPRALLS